MRLQLAVRSFGYVDADGNVHGDALLAAAGIGEIVPGRFAVVLCPEGVRTSDDREFALGAISWRELPIALTNALDVGDDHYGAIVGAIETIERFNMGATAELRGTGGFDLGSAAGQEAARLVFEQFKRWVSVDLEIISFEMFEEGDCAVDSTPDSEIDFYPPADCHVVMRVTEGRIMGAAMCAFAAFPQAVIVSEGVEIPAATDDGRPAAEPVAVAAAGIPIDPPDEWFADPAFTERCALTVTDDGRVFGHLATWDSCHIGRADACVTPPHSPQNYAYFATGSRRVACDCPESAHHQRQTGVITLGGGHASITADPRAAAAHYDDAGAAVADVCCGEDTVGIWLAGALRPNVSPEQIVALRGSSLSGDWRRIGGTLELVAALAVNVPGFPIPRARVAAGEPTALVAAGAIRRPPAWMADLARLERRMTAAMEARLGSLNALVRAFGPEAATRIRDELLAHGER